MANRTPVSEWGRLFNFAGGGLVHMELFPFEEIMAQGPTWLELIAANLLQWGLNSAKPTATDVANGTYYYATDTAKLWQSRSGSWSELTFTLSPYAGPRAAAHKNTNLTVATGTFTDVPWNVVDYDTDDIFDLGADDTLLTIPQDGIYQFSANIAWTNSASGQRGAYVSVNGVDHPWWNQAIGMAAYYATNTFGGPMNLAQGDELVVQVAQNSGGDLDVISPTDFLSRVAICWIAPTP